jgi:hypothetical protein
MSSDHKRSVRFIKRKDIYGDKDQKWINIGCLINKALDVDADNYDPTSIYLDLYQYVFFLFSLFLLISLRL